MSLNKGKHIVEEINGIRCTIVEKGLSDERCYFLAELLKANGFSVEVTGEPENLTLGVTDLLFNPVIAVYQQRLKTSSGEKVSPAYWNQLTIHPRSEYWEPVNE